MSSLASQNTTQRTQLRTSSILIFWPRPEKSSCLALVDGFAFPAEATIRMDNCDELAALKDRNAELEARMNLVTALLHDSMSSPTWRIVYRYRQLADKWRWRRSRGEHIDL